MRFLTKGPRSVASVADALAGVGGIVVAGGLTLVAFHLFGEDTNNALGALVMAVVFALGYLALVVAPRPTHPAWIAVTAIAVPGVFSFLWLYEADSFGDVRLFLLATLAGWIACFFAPHTRSRPVYIGLSLLLLWGWAMAEIDSGVLESQQRRSGVETEHEVDVVAAVARPAQTVALDDLDPNDPLYPLAEACAGGDDAACDDLWLRSGIGSDFETFAESCGGRKERVFRCADDSEGDFGDEFEFEDDFDDDFFAEDPVSPFPYNDLITPTGSDEKALEMGLVSLVLAVVYLGSMVAADRRGYQYVGTAFAFPGVWVLVFAVGFLGEEIGEALAIGVLYFVAGVAVAALGHLGERRFTTWAGAAIAGFGGVVVAGDLGSVDNAASKLVEGEVDLLQPGLVIAIGGLAIVALALLAHTLISRPPSSTPGTGVPPGAPPPDDTGRWAAPPAPEPPGAAAQWAPPAATPPSAAPVVEPPDRPRGESSRPESPPPFES